MLWIAWIENHFTKNNKDLKNKLTSRLDSISMSHDKSFFKN